MTSREVRPPAPHAAFSSVGPRAARWCAAAAVLSSTTVALAEPPATSSYALPLGLSYVALPALTTGALLAFPNASSDQGAALAVSVIAVGLAAPITVHAVAGEPRRALVSPLGALGTTALGGLLGLAVGAIVADATCPARTPNEDGNGCSLGPLVISMSAGAGVGYATWAVYDTLARSSADASSGPTVSVAPRVSRTTAGLDLTGAF